MMAAAPLVCWAISAKAKSSSRTALMTAMPAPGCGCAGGWANIKPISRRVNIPAFSPFLYRFRNLVERFFNKLKHFRAIATRFEKHDANYLALVKLAAARIWMRFMSR